MKTKIVLKLQPVVPQKAGDILKEAQGCIAKRRNAQKIQNGGMHGLPFLLTFSKAVQKIDQFKMNVFSLQGEVEKTRTLEN